MNLRRILLCITGEAPAGKAEDLAIQIAKGSPAELCAVFIVNPILNKFAHEIYAVGRDEYRRYMDKATRDEGAEALTKFERKARGQQVEVTSKIRCGSPEEEILREIDEGDYDLAVMMAGPPQDRRSPFRPHTFSETVFKKATTSIVFVR